MIILAFDISSVSTGWCVIRDEQPIPDAYGIVSPDKKESIGRKLLYFASEVKRLIDLYHPTDVIIEDVFYSRNVVSFKILAMYRGVALKTIYEHTGHEAHSMMAVEARKIVGVGCRKEEAFEGIIRKYKLQHFNFDFVRDNDVVDSFCLAYALRDFKAGKTVPPKPYVKRPKKKRKTKTAKRKTRKIKK